MLNKEIHTDKGNDSDALVKMVKPKHQGKTNLRKKAKAMWGAMEEGAGSTDTDAYNFLGYDPY